MKTILITGSTDGIGKLTAKNLAAQGHRIYLHGRDSLKLKATIQELKTSTGNTEVFGEVADLSDLSEVVQFAKKLTTALPKLEVLINNAGVYHSKESFGKQGIDLRFTVNYLAPVVLTTKLLPLLKKSSDPRVINLSSAAQAPVSLKVLKKEEDVSAQLGYAQSKLALTMWSFFLAEQEKELQVLAVNPGSLLNTKMVQEAFGQHWSSADKGANLLTDLAVSNSFHGITKAYFDNDLGDPRGDFSKAHADAYDASKINALMTTTEAVLKNLGVE